ncbi:MAG: HAD-IB family phosphatase, partial [Candidatus Eisenbacteria bacterium]|nr:HAD-IB family phosphatase [Candidatus Eisenbacteria bacterium]
MSLREPMILSVSGRDRPGVLAALARVLSQSGIELVDIEQATLQDFLALSFLVDLSEDPAKSQAILHRFFAAAGEWGLQVQVRPLSPAEVQELRSTNLWALTVLGAAAAAGTVAALAAVTSHHQANIVSIRRLAESDIRAAEFLLDVARVPDADALRRDLIQESERLGVDISLAPEAIYRQSKRVVVMDGDSTLIAGEVIDEMARLAGVAPEVSRITERAMAGELDFAEALRARVKLLAGLEREALERLADAIPLTPGAEETIRVLKRLGFKVGVISGG